MHHGCKVVFIFDRAEDINPEVRLSGFFTLKIFDHHSTKLHFALEEILRGKEIICNREDCVQKISKKLEEMKVLD